MTQYLEEDRTCGGQWGRTRSEKRCRVGHVRVGVEECGCGRQARRSEKQTEAAVGSAGRETSCDQ